MDATSVIKLCCKLCCEKWVNSSVILLFTIFFRTAWTKFDQDLRSSTVLNAHEDQTDVMSEIYVSSSLEFSWSTSGLIAIVSDSPGSVGTSLWLEITLVSLSVFYLLFFYFYIRKTLVLNVMVMVAPRRSLKTHLIQSGHAHRPSMVILLKHDLLYLFLVKSFLYLQSVFSSNLWIPNFCHSGGI